MRMELESQHLDDFEDIFAFRDDTHHSPSQPGTFLSHFWFKQGVSWMVTHCLLHVFCISSKMRDLFNVS